MSLFEVRFIRDADDEDSKHVVVEIEAINHDQALSGAREMNKGEVWLANCLFWSVEIRRI